jgi:CubicO group peptidase (beta-lactamase class C family)
VFAYAVMKLVDAGKLDLDRPLTAYLPGTYDVGADPRLGLITARHALSHTTGLPNWRTGALTIQLPPGTQFSYSGEGIVYLAKVVEHITGEPFEAFMQRTVFGPLGMTSSSYDPPSDAAGAATPHDMWGEPIEQPRPLSRDRNPAAGLRTTAGDYARFVIAVLRGTGLSPAARARMLTPQIHVIDGGPGSIGRPDPRPLRDLTWGLGWGLAATAGGTAFWHWGDNDSAKAYVVALEEARSAVVVFANSANGLSIMPEIVAKAVGVPEPGQDWLGYESYDSPGRVLAKAIRTHGADAALREYRTGRSARISERQLNTLGYQLAAAHRIADAIAVLAQNVADHPQSANTHDSLGEIYDLAGDRDHAIESYKRSVALDPGNTNAIQALARLRGAPAP